MLVKLIQLPKKTELYLRVDDIRSIQRSAENPLETVVSVSIMTLKGPLGYLVQDSPNDIAEQIMAFFKVTK